MAKEDIDETAPTVQPDVLEDADARAQAGHEGDPAADDLAAAEKARDERGERSSGKRLTRHVHVTNPHTGERKVFGPEDDLPDWAAEAITNPKAFANVDRPDADPETPVPGANQFVVNGVPVRNRDDLYSLSKSELLDLAEAAGIEGLTNRDTKQDIVESITAQ